MKNFKSKKEAFNHLKNKFLLKGVSGIVVQGSTAKGKIKEFSDMDVVIFNNKTIKPHYELCLINKKIVIISIYFYKPGNIIKTPKNGYIIYGNFFEQIEHEGYREYNKQERIKRNSQLFLDFLFKFLRCKDKKYLKTLDKYSRLLKGKSLKPYFF